MVIADRNGEPLRIFLPPDEKYRFPVKLEELPPDLPRAIVASEDRSFYQHPGVDPLAVLRAMRSNLSARRVISGASTIPMQIARMTDRRPRRLSSKAIEALRAMQLTAHHSKRELLEIYLNLAPYGSNIEGVSAASWFYFGKPAKQLSIGEIALLTTLPRSPNQYDPLRDPRRSRAARNQVLDQLAERGGFDLARIDAAKRQPVPNTRRRAPFNAPHFCDFVHNRSGETSIATTLDSHLQQQVEQRLIEHVRHLRGLGVENAAVVVIDNKTREVRAFVGSAGFFERSYYGEVNGAFARRSPGSALKPFLYAKAFDEGSLVPDSYLLDIPTDYSGYVPENYDGTFRGRVTVRESLVRSLNAPAVRLLSAEGVDQFLTLLRRGGMRTLDRSASDYGLTLVLGSGEVTLLDLTNLYATLAVGGKYQPVRYLAQQPVAAGDRLFSPEATALVTEMMCDLQRPDLPRGWELTVDVPRIAWKTGTSYGHRDAWSVGFSATTTIGVWVGNFDGHGEKGISGSEHAAPLLFDLFRLIDPKSVVRAREMQGLEMIEVCSRSHEIAGPYCPHRIRVRQIAGKTHLPICSLHRQILVDAKSGARLVGGCGDTARAVARVVEVEPRELVAFRRAQHQGVEELPLLSPTCRELDGEEPPHIVSPDPTTPYRIRRDAPIETQRILLAAHASTGMERLYWYADGILLTDRATDEPAFLTPSRGKHEVTVVDNAGRSDSVVFEVR